MKKLHYLIIIIMLLGFCLNAQVFVTGGGVGGWDPNGRVFLTSTDGINYSSTADFEVTGPLKIGEAPGWQTIWGYDSALGSGWPGGTLPSTCGDCGTDISPSSNGWYSVTYNINTNEYLFSPGINPFGPYPTFAPATPLTFEEPQTTIYYKYEDFGNNTGSDPKGGLSKIANPHKEGINTSNTVFQMTKRGASWSGSKFFTAPAIDFSTSSKIIKIKIWSPRVGAKLKLKFEGGGGDDQVEVESTVANAWEELIFDFSSKTMGISRTEIVFQFEDGLNDGYDPNTPAQSNVADYTWLIDDISIVIAPPTAASQTFCTAQSATVNNLVATGTTLKWYAAASGGSALASNEALVEGTYYVSQTVGGNESPRTSVAVTIYSNTPVTESACGTYTWPLSGVTYTASGTYSYTSGLCSTTLNLTITPITNNTTVVSATNPYTWSNNGQVYATSGIKTGTTTNCVTELLNLTITNPVVHVTGGGVGGWDPNGRVFLTSTDGINYSSTASFEITGDVKIGEATGFQNIWGYDEALGSGWPGGTLPSTCGDCGKNISPAANGWYNVTYNRNTKVYLFSPGINPFGPYPTFAPSTPLTFEEPQTTIYYKTEDFGNETNQGDPKGGITKIANPHKEGINTSNTVFQMIKRGWASWSGSKFFTTSAIDFSASSKIIKIKIWSPRVGVKLKLKFEGDGDDQLEVESTVANAWEELIFDFSAKTMGTTRNQIAFQFEDGLNNGFDPNTPAQSNVADYTWLIDDISIVIAPPTAASQTFCTSQSATVNNLVATGTALKWYAAASGGSALASNVALVEGTYYVSQTVGGNESPRTSVAVTIISNTPVTESACGTYTWPLNGVTYTASGTYSYTSGPCSTTLNLTITPVTYNTTVVSAANPYTWSNNGQAYATSGIKTGTTTNCVTELLNLTITNPVVFVTGAGVGGWDPNGRVFLTSTNGINYSSTSDFEVTGGMKIGEATGFENIGGYDSSLGSGSLGGTIIINGGSDIYIPSGWYSVTYNRNTKVYLFTTKTNPYGPYPTFSQSTPLTFEEPIITIYYKTEDFGNNTGSDPKGGLTKIANPHKEGINTSNTVFQMIKRGASWSGSKFFTSSAINFSASKIVKVKIWSPRVGAKLKLKFEGGGGDDQVEVASTVANAWEELIFDFSAITMGTSRNQIVFQFDDGINDGATGFSDVADYTWFIDDITLVYVTKIRPMQCGKTLRWLNEKIQATPVSGATQYRFEVIRTDNALDSRTITINTYLFNPATHLLGGLIYGKSYFIRVKTFIGATENPYGNTCIITAPAEPLVTTTKIRPFQCEKTLLYMTQPVEATPVYLATTYEFEVTSGAGMFVKSSPNYTFSLYYSVPGRALYGTAYSIRVRSKGAATAFTAWGDPCVVTTPMARMSETNVSDSIFNVKSLPNPFASHFSLDIESSSEAQVEMKVYDMIGRQLEAKKANVSELSTLQIGINYPTGIYNVIVSQGKNVKSIRMIKR